VKKSATCNSSPATINCKQSGEEKKNFIQEEPEQTE
jgi:hypothetical protein